MVRKKPAPELVRNVRALFGNDRTLANLKPIKKCLAIRHVAFEDLGLLGPLVSSRGYGVRYHDAGVQPIDAETLLAPDLLIVLGGPIGVYETDAYPFIADEITAIAARLAAGRPTLGICLGAQMMAAALGARVAPGPVKEIGWAPLQLTAEGEKSLLGAARGDASAALARRQLRIAGGLHQACFDAALPGASLHGCARSARLAVSSRDRAGALRNLARRSLRRTRQSRHRSASSFAIRRANSEPLPAKPGRKCFRPGSTRRWVPHELSRSGRRIAVENAGTARQALAEPAARRSHVVSRRRSGASPVHAGG